MRTILHLDQPEQTWRRLAVGDFNGDGVVGCFYDDRRTQTHAFIWTPPTDAAKK